jgi:hypothetical protein
MDTPDFFFISTTINSFRAPISQAKAAFLLPCLSPGSDFASSPIPCLTPLASSFLASQLSHSPSPQPPPEPLPLTHHSKLPHPPQLTITKLLLLRLPILATVLSYSKRDRNDGVVEGGEGPEFRAAD